MSLLGILRTVDLAEELLLELVVEDLVVDEPGIRPTHIVLVNRICDILRLERVIEGTAFWL